MISSQVESRLSGLESGGSRLDPLSPEINVTINVRVLPPFNLETQMYLAPAPNDEDRADTNHRRDEPASVIPTTTSPISPGLSKFIVP